MKRVKVIKAMRKKKSNQTKATEEVEKKAK